MGPDIVIVGLEIDREEQRRRLEKNNFVAKKLIGEVCLTRYNNKTYKIGKEDDEGIGLVLDKHCVLIAHLET